MLQQRELYAMYTVCSLVVIPSTLNIEIKKESYNLSQV